MSTDSQTIKNHSYVKSKSNIVFIIVILANASSILERLEKLWPMSRRNIISVLNETVRTRRNFSEVSTAKKERIRFAFHYKSQNF